MNDTEIKVNLSVSTEDAVRAGKARSGDFQITLTEAGLAQLTPEERNALAPFVAGAGGRMIWAPASNPTPTWEAFVEGLRATLANEAKEAEEAAAKTREDAAKALAHILTLQPEALLRSHDHSVCSVNGACPFYVYEEAERIVMSDPRAANLFARAEEISKRRIAESAAEKERRRAAAKEAEEQKTREAAERAQQYADACAAFIAHHGTPSQIARREEGLLPQGELEDTIRDHLFAPLNIFGRYKKLTKEDVAHTAECEGPDMRYAVEDATEASPELYDRLVSIRKACPTFGRSPGAFRSAATPDVACTLREHKATCVADGCDDSESVYRYSVLVTITWHGHEFSREYLA